METTARSSAWAASVAVIGGLGYGLVGLARSWSERERPAIGYVQGKPVAIMVVAIDGKPVEVATAGAYRRMQAAASTAGVEIKVVSGFRTMAEQEYLYGCYIHCSCNNCNLAAEPGHSNHQSGHALDLNARDPEVVASLRAHAHEYGFRNTIASEPWHWEYWP